MGAHKSHFNRNFLIALITLYLLTLAFFRHANWAADPEITQGWMVLLNIPILLISALYCADWQGLQPLPPAQKG